MSDVGENRRAWVGLEALTWVGGEEGSPGVLSLIPEVFSTQSWLDLPPQGCKNQGWVDQCES